MAIKEVLADGRNSSLPTPASVAIAIGDLLYWDSVALVEKPANQRPDLGSLIANQRDFAMLFCGVSADARLATETSTGNDSRRLGILDGIFDCDCLSSTWEVDDLIGIDRNAAIPMNYTQQVIKVTNPCLAIGSVIKREPNAVTKVRARLMSARGLLSLDMFCGIQSIGARQGRNGTILPDANAVLTAGTNPILSMVPTAPRTLTLPAFALSPGLLYKFTNNSGGANTVTFVNPDNSAVKGNGAVLQNKTADLFFDNAVNSWVGNVSA